MLKVLVAVTLLCALGASATLFAQHDRTIRVVAAVSEGILPKSCEGVEQQFLDFVVGYSANTLPGMEQACMNWTAQVKTCFQDAAKISGEDQKLMTAITAWVDTLCTVSDNRLCAANYFAADPAVCRRRTGNCGDNCTLAADGTRCVLTISRPYVTSICSSCFGDLITVMRAVLVANASYQTAAEAAPKESELVSFEASREAMCATAPSGRSCVDVTGVLGSSEAQQNLTRFLDDESTVLPFGLWSPDVADDVCADFSSRQCFRKIAMGALNSKTLRAPLAYSQCRANGYSMDTCSERRAVNQWKLNSFLNSSAFMCKDVDTADERCIAIGAQLSSATLDCISGAYQGTCTSSCRTKINAARSAMGCCASTLLPPLDETMFTTEFPTCWSYWEGLQSSMPPSCTTNSSTVVRRSIPIRIDFPLIQASPSLAATIGQLVVRDLCARLGIPLQFIVDTDFENGLGEKLVTDEARRFRALANATEAMMNETKFVFGLKAESNSDTAALAQTVSSDLSNFELPSTTQYLQQNGYISAGSSANEDKGKSSPSSDDGPSLGLIIGIVAAGVVVLLLLIVVVVVVMRKKASRTGYEGVDEQQSMATGQV